MRIFLPVCCPLVFSKVLVSYMCTPFQVKTNGFSTTPLQLCSYWKCDEEATDLRVDYRYNPSCMSAPCSIGNLSVLVPMNGGVTIMQSKPSATW